MFIKLHSFYKLTPDTEFFLNLSAILLMSVLLVLLSFFSVIFSDWTLCLTALAEVEPSRTVSWRARGFAGET